MDADGGNDNGRVDAPQLRRVADAQLALHERLIISALVAGVSLWIRVVEVIPDSRRR